MRSEVRVRDQNCTGLKLNIDASYHPQKPCQPMRSSCKLSSYKRNKVPCILSWTNEWDKKHRYTDLHLNLSG